MCRPVQIFTRLANRRFKHAVDGLKIMISEVILGYYDIHGKKVAKLSSKLRKYFKPTFPMGRYLSQPLVVKCSNFAEMREFLKQCSYVSDQEQFNRADYWMPPEDFEAVKKGDCEDFALWTWRQLINMGYETRFVVGRAGRYGEGHAWVTFVDNQQGYLFEPLAAWISNKLPKLSTVRYEPYFSVAWIDEKVRYYIHKNGVFSPTFVELLRMLLEWVSFWSRYMPLIILRRVKYQCRRLNYVLKNIHSL